jgi:two-component system nitrogen regulation sensor histidine kinase NtrY
VSCRLDLLTLSIIQTSPVLKSKPVIHLIAFLTLLVAGSLLGYFSWRQKTPEALAKEIGIQLTRELQRVEEEVADIVSVIDSPAFVATKITYPYFVYHHDSLVFWSDNHYVPSIFTVSDTFDTKIIKTASSAYLLKKTLVADFGFVINLITLQRDYIIHNDYLNIEWNRAIFPSGEFRILDSGAVTGVPVCIHGECLFNIVFEPDGFSPSILDALSFITISFSLVFLILLVGDGLKLIPQRFAEIGVLYLYFIFLGIRWAMLELQFPARFLDTPLFDPQVFASSAINSSLGDLLINILALLAICLFVFQNFYRFYLVRIRSNAVVLWLLDLLCGVFIFFASLFPFVVIQTIYNNSSIVLDISESLAFDPLRLVGLVVVVISVVCFFLFAHPFISILGRDKSKIRVVICILVSAGIFAFINNYSGQQYESSLVLGLFYFFTVYFLRLFRQLSRLSYATFTYLFVAIFFTALNAAYAVQHFSHKEKIESQFRFSSTFLIDRDIFGEYLLHDAAVKIANDAFTQARIVTPFLGTEAIGLKIRQVFLPSYFNKYDVEIFIFNASGDAVGNPLLPSFSEMVRQYQAEPFRTSYEGIYFVNNPESDITQKYLIVIPIQRQAAIAGYVVVELSLKKIIPESVYPELLVDYGFQQFYRTQNLSYGIFVNGNILFTSGNFNYEKFFNRALIGNVDLYTKGVTLSGYDHIAQEDQNGKIAVVSTPTAPFSYQVANFSFFIVLGLLIILVLIFFQGVFNYFQGRRLFFSARIQLYLNLAFFIPLIIVSVSIVSLTNQSSQQQLDREYLNKSRVFTQEINSELYAYFTGSLNATTFNNRLGELATLSNLDANVYDPDGVLLATSQPLIFESHLLSNYINSSALSKIKDGENSFIESEKVGKLEYFIAYTAIKSTQTAELIGILGVPFFQSAYLLEQAQITIITNILNIFAFIFIALLVLSYFVSESLTFPLKFITQSLRKTSFNKLNQPLTWNTDDEIGMMVKEYNSMLYHLSESKNQLEQTQREKAWREIAQQVAHEIKNPLTPMKLTLQQLERSIQAANGSTEKSQKAIAVLLAQVDTLNDIASSFSGFAKMPEPVIRKMDLVATVKSAVDLHSPGNDIAFKTSSKEILVLGDEQMLHRTFSNLILNALQAGKPGQSLHISVSMTRTTEIARVSIQDTGKGIDPDIRELVFLPHFSTKRSGSGIGLALSKQGIELMKGRIWFESKVGEGTTFFIELPVVS